MTDRDYEQLGLVAGLEIHQQLDTATKLFCDSPAVLREESEAERTFTRYLHPTKSELGEVDEAAREESRVDREFEYLAYDTTCLVEEDDEPPGRVDEEALTIAVQIARLLDARIVDRVEVMRKIVIDGSNTSGFQRSMIVAQNGAIETEYGTVGIEELMLEEESARRVTETEEGVRYSLDRLGIPLVEIGTAPDIRTPEGAQAAAERIGTLLRSTGDVRRGLGTIRQDVNVSIDRGARVEIKGVQALDQIAEIVELEVDRQVALADIAEELQRRGASVGEPRDVTSVFEETDSGVIRGAIENGGRVQAVRLAGFDGLVGREIAPDRRLGTELSDHAKRSGAGGVFHTDELPAYGVTSSELEALRAAVEADEEDAVALVADESETAALAIEAVADRAETAIDGVPEETRGANEDASTEYLRPLPGAARLYPETDVPPVEPDPSEVELPEPLDEKADRYADDYGLDPTLAERVAFGRRWPVFEESVTAGVDPSVAAGALEETLVELRREDVPVERLSDDALVGTLELVADGDLAKEGLGDVFTELAADPSLSPDDAVEEAGLGGVDDDAVRETVREIVDRHADQVEREGMGAFSALMGEAMGALRGKADGELVSDLLREEIQART